MARKYVVEIERRPIEGDLTIRHFDSQEEANIAARRQWDSLTESDKRNITISTGFVDNEEWYNEIQTDSNCVIYSLI